MAIRDFFSREAGQRRRQFLTELIDDNVEQFIPPNLRALAGFVTEANPIRGMGNAIQSSRVVFDPEQTREARLRAAADMGMEMAFAVSPAVLARMGYLTPVAGAMESLLGGSPTTEAIKEQAGRTAADATGIARSVASGDTEMLGEIFQRGADEAKPLSASVPSDQFPLVMDYEDIEVVDPMDLVGATFTPTPADLLSAGTKATGTTAAGNTRQTQRQGGILFPLQNPYYDADVGWLVDAKGKATTKLGKDADIIGVTAMSQVAHQSNRSTADEYLGELEAFVRDGRISPENIKAINKEIRDYGEKTTQPELKRLKDFVGFDSPNFDAYMQAIGFDARAAISKQMSAPKMEKYGVPNFQKVLDSNIEQRFIGQNQGDSILFFKPDRKRGIIDLEAEGLPPHLSYRHGFGREGELFRMKMPVRRGLMYPTFEAEYATRPSMLTPSGQVNEANVAYAFGRALPTEKMTVDQARNIQEATDLEMLQNPTQARMIESALNGQWSTSLTAKKDGGVSPTDYERALRRNPSFPSLEPYTAADITAGKKSGDLVTQQLGGGDIYFSLKKNPDYTWMNDGKPIPELGPNEVDLVGVINNERGAKGIAGPSILGKAIEDGATVLNAFAVPSKAHPDGFLNNLYGGYGFEEIKRVPFSKEFYIEDRGQKAYDDLLRQWRSEGWDESQGFPDVVLMKWKGTDEQRRNASQRVFEKGFEGFGSGTTRGVVAKARGTSRQGAGSSDGQKASGQNNRRGNTGTVQSGGGSPISSRLRGALDEYENLTSLQRRNLGLLSDRGR